jgi:hypothetical protein
VDGDIVEEKNTIRQPYQSHDVGKYKAEALATKINSATHYRGCSYINEYITDIKQLEKLDTEDEILLIGAVDNHPARKILHKFFKKTKSTIHYIDSANEDYNGEVVVSSKHNEDNLKEEV